MAETLDLDGRWLWYHIMNDLATKGGFGGVIIDPLSLVAHSCGGETRSGTLFCITWMKDLFLMVSLNRPEQPLIDALADVVEYRPFCKYISEVGLLTFEWDKKDPEGRFAELQKEGVADLQKIC